MGHKIFLIKKGNGLAGTVVTDEDFPGRPARTLLSTILNDYVNDVPQWQNIDQQESVNYPKLTELAKKPLQEIDQISKIQADLNDTKQIAQQSIEGLLNRGEKLDDLVQKSDDLTSQSKMFYRQARKTNSCCVIM